jgi:hypothetical protein
MRIALLLSIALCCGAFALPANAAVMPNGPGFLAAQAVTQRCPPGSWWIPEGYQWKGKWKAAHCSKVTTRSS